MALSASESELLTKTCTNMNVAANTCREVLEMLRSLGSSGVVDIATHSNDATPHSGATNLFFVNPSTKTAYLGVAGAHGANNYSNYRSYEIRYSSSDNTYNPTRISALNGKTDHPVLGDHTYTADTDSAGELLTTAQAYALLDAEKDAYANTTRRLVNADRTIQTIVSYYLGNSLASSGNGYKTTSVVIALSKTSAEGSAGNLFEFNEQAFMPASASATLSLGTSGFPFDTAYLETAATVTSDMREKTSVDPLDEKAENFILSLRPVQFKKKTSRVDPVSFDEKTGEAVETEAAAGVRTHWGLIAQEVKEAMSATGIEDAAVWCLSDKSDPDSRQALRYEELIAPMIKVIQNQQERIEALERKVA